MHREACSLVTRFPVTPQSSASVVWTGCSSDYWVSVSLRRCLRILTGVPKAHSFPQRPGVSSQTLSLPEAGTQAETPSCQPTSSWLDLCKQAFRRPQKPRGLGGGEGEEWVEPPTVFSFLKRPGALGGISSSVFMQLSALCVSLQVFV